MRPTPPNIRELVAQHREGMQYLSELGAYIHDVQRGKNVQHLNGWIDDTFSESFKNMPSATVDPSYTAYKEVKTDVRDIAKNVSEIPGDTVDAVVEFKDDVVNAAKPWIIWGAVGIAVLILAPHVLDYMSSRNKRG